MITATKPLLTENKITLGASGSAIPLVLFVILLAIGGVSFEVLPIAVPFFIAAFVVFLVGVFGFTVLAPNEVGVATVFGRYIGTCYTNGIIWTAPWVGVAKLSTRAQNFASDKIKVNDKKGNPVEIGAAIVWQVEDPAKALFDVENYTQYVRVQSEAAIRSLAGEYAYIGDDNEKTLLHNGEEISQELVDKLNTQLKRAGIIVTDARLTHLAYSQEVAGAMLQLQQADATVRARKSIVTGAVGIVEDALKQLEKDGGLKYTDSEKKQLTSNLLLILCGNHDVRPVVSLPTAS